MALNAITMSAAHAAISQKRALERDEFALNRFGILESALF